MNLQPITPAQALAQNLWPLSTGLEIPSEEWIAKNILADQAKAGTACAAVRVRPGQIEVWRGGTRLGYLSGYKAGVASTAKYNLAHAACGASQGRRKQ